MKTPPKVGTESPTKRGIHPPIDQRFMNPGLTLDMIQLPFGGLEPCAGTGGGGGFPFSTANGLKSRPKPPNPHRQLKDTDDTYKASPPGMEFRGVQVIRLCTTLLWGSYGVATVYERISVSHTPLEK